MCTLTVSYDKDNAFAKQLVELMHTSGVFVFQDEDNTELSEEEEKEAFLQTSRINASKMFAKYL